MLKFHWVLNGKERPRNAWKSEWEDFPKGLPFFFLSTNEEKDSSWGKLEILWGVCRGAIGVPSDKRKRTAQSRSLYCSQYDSSRLLQIEKAVSRLVGRSVGVYLASFAPAIWKKALESTSRYWLTNTRTASGAFAEAAFAE